MRLGIKEFLKYCLMRSDKINDLGISQIYYDYRNRTYINTAEEWCRNYHVPYRRKED